MKYLFFLLLLSFVPLCAETDFLVVPKGDVIQRDFYGAKSGIEISGRIMGDLFLVGGQIFIDGIVDGDLIVTGGSIHISGEVKQNIRVMGGQVILTGQVGKNITIIAGAFEVGKDAKVGGSIAGLLGTCDIAGDIGKDAKLYAANVRISGRIGGDVEASTPQLRFTSFASIGGNLDYWSEDPAFIDTQSVIKGEVVHHHPFFHDVTPGKWIEKLRIGSKIIGTAMNFLYTLIFGLLLLKFFPQKLERSINALRNEPGKSLLYGCVILIVLPIISLILLFTVLGAPFALTLIALNIVGFYAAKVIIVFWGVELIIEKAKWKRRKYTYFTLGLLCYFILSEIPIVGMIVTVAAVLFGLGSMLLMQTHTDQKST